MIRRKRHTLLAASIGPPLALLWLIGWAVEGAAQGPAPWRRVPGDAPPEPPYAARIREAGPAAYWRFEGQVADAPWRSATAWPEASDAGSATVLQVGGQPRLGPGPERAWHPAFAADNQALLLDGRSHLRMADSPHSGLDFDLGDAVTLEAWVKVDRIDPGQQCYILGKGRGAADRENQNYALRLTGGGRGARLSFLFRSRAAGGQGEQYHRWTSEAALPLGRWTHVAVTYRFGAADSLAGYLNGRPVAGVWDMGGATDRGPVVDDDDLWIGSARGGEPGNSLAGSVDEIAIYRRQLPPGEIRRHFSAAPPQARDVQAILAALPVSGAQWWVGEAAEGEAGWAPETPPLDRFVAETLAANRLPARYGPGGVRLSWPSPTVLRGAMRWRTSEPIQGQWLLRAKSAARLWIDGELVLETPFMQRNASGHEEVPDLPPPLYDAMPAAPPGHQRALGLHSLPAGEHLVEVEAVVGGPNLRVELGELLVAWRPVDSDSPFSLLHQDAASDVEPRLVEADWYAWQERSAAAMFAHDAANRRRAASLEDPYWRKRHAAAREYVASLPALPRPAAVEGLPRHNAVDDYLNSQWTRRTAELSDADLATLDRHGLRLADDAAFLRRLSLDAVGTPPSLPELQAYLAAAERASDSQVVRRAAIDRLLDDPRWADHWVGYWQDVLAENPGILKPEQNNTGPFRWWIYESMVDNKALDRFATELILMRGDKYAGGPAGFAMATQNDAPMAAKAHILTKAFLAQEMKCARCHDAPYHPFKQEQLFRLAAMLQRQPLTLPASSTVPVEPGGRQPLVEVSLQPGASLPPSWPFEELVAPSQVAFLAADQQDTRQQLALLMTAPHNDRFAKVLVNRLWKRLMGRGLIEPVDDWTAADAASHPELLEFLARELVRNDYDWKHVARLIFQSHAYQRSPGEASLAALYLGPLPRRLTAEQLVDSLHQVTGKAMDCEMLTLDPEGRRPDSSFLNLGRPTRAWQLTSLSNERDRPALALPGAQSLVDLLTAFGWREARPDPITDRPQDATVLQPLTLANGSLGARLLRLTDDGAITELALVEQPVEALVERLFLTVLSRPPTSEEAELFADLLRPGYEQRRLEAPPQPPQRMRFAVSWSNHLNAEATRIKMELEEAIRRGPTPTPRLAAPWRQRCEDALWALVNSPEFLFTP